MQNGLGPFSYLSSFIFPVHKDRKNNGSKAFQTQSTYNLRYIDDTSSSSGYRAKPIKYSHTFEWG
jgi:hypothetical protein